MRFNGGSSAPQRRVAQPAGTSGDGGLNTDDSYEFGRNDAGIGVGVDPGVLEMPLSMPKGHRLPARIHNYGSPLQPSENTGTDY